LTYGELIREYARQRRLRRWLISVPVLRAIKLFDALWIEIIDGMSSI